MLDFSKRNHDVLKNVLARRHFTSPKQLGPYRVLFNHPELAKRLERLEESVSWRQDVAKQYAEVIGDCDWFVPQRVPPDVVHTYWCYTVLLKADEKALTWHEFRDQYVEFGGDPIYGAWRPVHLEPVFREERFYGKGCPNHCPLYEGTPQKYQAGLCPVTERLQPNLFQFRTNYDEERANRQMEALAQTIAYFNGKN